MVIAMFLSRVFYSFGLAQTFVGLVIGHTLLSMPYMLRILATAFEAIPQDVIDAARNLGAGRLCAGAGDPGADGDAGALRRQPSSRSSPAWKNST